MCHLKGVFSGNNVAGVALPHWKEDQMDFWNQRNNNVQGLYLLTLPFLTLPKAFYMSSGSGGTLPVFVRSNKYHSANYYPVTAALTFISVVCDPAQVIYRP